MPINRNALIRYQTIDKCLQNRFRKWTLEDLIEAVSEALYEYEGIEKGVSMRTVQADIQMMRSEKLGYNAPIIVVDKKYYMYEDPKYSITNIPLTDNDLGKLKEIVEMLKQFKGFTHFKELSGMVQRLEDKVYTAKTHQNSVIDFEKNENLKGLEYLETIYQAILQKKALQITYQSFKASQKNTFDFNPYLLKEYRNRWFVLGIRDGFVNEATLALDRIQAIQPSIVQYTDNQTLNLSEYYRNVIGVTVNANQAPEKIVLWIRNDNAPYVLTKPLHHSQQLLENQEDGIVVSIEVQHNFELEREIMGFGESMLVLSPEKLKKRIQYKIMKMSELYINT
jgi:predicted DNA-binding transcriptional regulator YafY